MKKTSKQILAVLLAGVMVASLGSCKTQGESGDSNGSKSQTSDEVITYSMFRNASYIQGYAEDGGKGKQVILDKLAAAGITNVDFKVMIGGGDEYFTKINAFAASDNLPNYFNVDFPTMTKFADQELIMELDELMKEHAPALTKMQRESDINAIKYNTKLYAVPPAYRPETFNGANSSGLVYRKDWLSKLGLDEPESLDDLYQTLKAFTENDPDGNGKKDTTGLAAWAEKDSIAGFDPIYAAYGIIPNFWYENDDGSLQQGATMPEIKEALKLLKQWYEEGLIDRDYPVAQRTQVEEKFINGKAGMAHFSALDVNTQTPIPASLKAANPDAVMAMAKPPKGPDGKSGYAESQPGYGDIRAISVNTKNPEILTQISKNSPTS